MAERPHLAGVTVLDLSSVGPAARCSRILADYGASVVKVGPPPRKSGVQIQPPYWSYSAGRGMRRLQIDLKAPDGRAAFMRLAAKAQVVIESFRPGVAARMGIGWDDVRAVNPRIIYVRGSAFGAKGPDAGKGGFDSSAFWSRGGGGAGITPPEVDGVLGMPAPAYGDSMGGMTIAGGIAAALFARERTGEGCVVDVSLLALAAWAGALAVDIALLSGEPYPVQPLSTVSALYNPVVGNVRTSDGRWLNLAMLQPGRYWADFCRHIDREDLITDERFAAVEQLMAHASEAAEIVKAEIATRTFAEWIERFQTLDGQWAPVQNSLELGRDPQLRANGFIASVADADGVERELVTNPVQFDEVAATLRRAPQFSEHGEEILRELGRTDDEIIQLKLDGVVT